MKQRIRTILEKFEITLYLLTFLAIAVLWSALGITVKADFEDSTLELGTVLYPGSYNQDNDPSNGDEPIEWHDAGLRQNIANAIDITDRPITIGDAQNVTSLKLNTPDESATDIVDISDLQYFTNLIELQMNWNQIEDITPLASLSKLESVTLNTNNISDMSPLAGLSRLKTIDISNNPLSNPEVVQYIPSLERLRVYNTGLDNDSFNVLTAALALNNTIKLLDFGGNSVTDFSSIKDLSTLVEVDIWDGNIDDKSFAHLTGALDELRIKVLHLRNNKISDLMDMIYLKELTDVNLSNNNITDVTPLVALKQLETLTISGNPISDYGPTDRMHIKNYTKDSDSGNGNKTSSIESASSVPDHLYDVYRSSFWEDGSIRSELGLEECRITEHELYHYESDHFTVWRKEGTYAFDPFFTATNTGDPRIAFNGMTIGTSLEYVLKQFDWIFFDADGKHASIQIGGGFVCDVRFDADNRVDWWSYSECYTS